MGDMGDYFNDLKAHKKQQREKLGRECRGCLIHHPNRNASILFPGQKCRWCGHQDERKDNRKEDK